MGTTSGILLTSEFMDSDYFSRYAIIMQFTSIYHETCELASTVTVRFLYPFNLLDGISPTAAHPNWFGGLGLLFWAIVGCQIGSSS